MPDDKKPEAQSGEPPAINITRPPFPIVLNLSPTISSLSPSAAVVGGSDFTLTVLGTQFDSAATVLWNGATRTTTLVSATQLTAAIGAADIAAVGTANVTVSKPGLLASAPPQVSSAAVFTIIPNIDDIINQLKGVPANPPSTLTDLQTYLSIQADQINNLSAQHNTDTNTIASLTTSNQDLTSENQQQASQIQSLTAQLAASKGLTAAPLDVAQSFKSVVDQIQQTALSAGGLQTTLTNMNVQLKALVNVQPATGTTPAQATLVFPDPSALPDPNHMSTLTFSFGAIPNLKPAASGPAGSSSSSSSSPSSSSSSVSSSSSSSSSTAPPPSPTGGDPTARIDSAPASTQSPAPGTKIPPGSAPKKKP